MTRLAGFVRMALAALAAPAALLLAAAVQLGAIGSAQAQAARSDLAEGCPGLISSVPPRAIPVSVTRTQRTADQVRLTYIGHSTFLIESPRLVRIATDYNDYIRPRILPDIVTMNRAHSTHYTDQPEPGIKHVLRGWMADGSPANHDVQHLDVRVRNVATNIRDWGGGTQRHGNSIFIFEVANLCIAHLGHLHHTLTKQQLAEIGRVDVVLVPVDGSLTLDLEGMVEVLRALNAPLMVPMHFFSVHTLDRFLERVKEHFAIEHNETPSILLSKGNLPASPKVVVLPGR